MSRNARRIAALLCIMAVAPAVTGCSGGSSPGFESPQACFDAMKDAAKKKDIGAMCDCLTDESQDAMAGVLVMAGSMMKMMSGMVAMGGPEAAAEAEKSLGALNAVLEKHGVTEEAMKDLAPSPQMAGDSAAILKLAAVVKDKRAFISDMVTALQQSGQGANFNERFDEQAAGDLKDVKVEGDGATAVVTAPSGEQPIEFRKVAGGGWKMHIDLDAMGPPGGGPPGGADEPPPSG